VVTAEKTPLTSEIPYHPLKKRFFQWH
jgi:hypothetical protein